MANAPKPKPKVIAKKALKAASKMTLREAAARKIAKSSSRMRNLSETVDQKRRPDGTYPKGTKYPGYDAQKGKAPKGPVTNKFSPIRPATPDKRIAGKRAN
jgi:hypothetical protein